MRDHELYATILGVQAPWRVERVELDGPGGAVHGWLARDESAAAECPECHTAQTIYDHREREWRHLDTCQLQTRLHARVPRVDCPTHGVLQSAVPWATAGSKFTLLFERLAIDWLREAAVTAVARQLKLGWDAVWGIERRAVARGLERRGTLALRYVGVDEEFLPAPARLRDRGERSRARARAVRGRRPQTGEPGSVLGARAHRRPTRGRRGDRDGHVGAVRARDPRPGFRRRREDRVRLLPLRQAPQRGRRSRALRRAPRTPGPRRHAAHGHQVRLAPPNRSLQAGDLAGVRGLT